MIVSPTSTSITNQLTNKHHKSEVVVIAVVSISKKDTIDNELIA